MKSENFIRILAGSMVLLSLLLGVTVSLWWLLLATFVGFNLIQSALTGFCPPTLIGRRLGWFNEDETCCGILERRNKDKKA